MMSYSLQQSADVDEHAARLPQWDQVYDQVSAGRFSGELEHLRLGPIELFRERTEPAVLQRGQSRPGTLTMGIALGGSSPGWFNGHAVRPGQPFALRSGREFVLATRGAFDVVAICAEIEYLDEYSHRVGDIGLEDCALGHAVFEPRADADGLSELILTTLETARESPRLLQQALLRNLLIQTLCGALLARMRVSQPRSAIEKTVASRQRVVHEARSYMSVHADEPIAVPDLCQAIHVSRRTLQYSFQDVLNMSPVSYLRALRLNGARRELRRGGDEPVADRAARWGFWHPSRFAADYRRMFGELPSETLGCARASQETAAPRERVAHAPEASHRAATRNRGAGYGWAERSACGRPPL